MSVYFNKLGYSIKLDMNISSLGFIPRWSLNIIFCYEQYYHYWIMQSHHDSVVFKFFITKFLANIQLPLRVFCC